MKTPARSIATLSAPPQIVSAPRRPGAAVDDVDVLARLLPPPAVPALGGDRQRNAGMVTGSTAVLARGVVDKTGQLPARST
jgi:hypothetical protein